MKESNAKSIKYNIMGILSYVTVEAVILSILFRRDWNQIGAMHILNIGIALIFLVLLFKSLWWPYIRVENGIVHIFPDTFIKKSFSIDDVSSIEIEVTPFTKSYFKLKDGSKIKFDTFGISSSNVEYLKNIIRSEQA